MEIEIDFLGGNTQAKFMNEFMHCGDVFEKGKQLAIHDRFIVTGNDSIDLEKLCERVANAYEQAGGYAVFVGIRSIDNKPVGNSHAWFMKDVQSISIGTKWGLFKDILNQLGYKAETDEHMKVVSVQ